MVECNYCLFEGFGGKNIGKIKKSYSFFKEYFLENAKLIFITNIKNIIIIIT